MTVKVEILDDDDEKNKGILRDGERRTIHMFDSKGDPLPGFTPVQIAIASTRAAMQSFDSSLHRPGYRYAAPTGTSDSAAPTRFGVHDSALEDAYAKRDREQADAWKGKTTDAKAPPEGGYSADDHDEGSSCTTNGGRPGKLCAMDDNDEWLICVADDGSDDGTGDSATDAKAKAYAAYDSDVSNAWRK